MSGCGHSCGLANCCWYTVCGHIHYKDHYHTIEALVHGGFGCGGVVCVVVVVCCVCVFVWLCCCGETGVVRCCTPASPHTGKVWFDCCTPSQCGCDCGVCVCCGCVVVGHTLVVHNLTILLPHSMRSLRLSRGSCLSRRIPSVACLTTFLLCVVSWVMVKVGGVGSLSWHASMCLAMVLFVSLFPADV
jgi:hypothetical protein